MVTAIGLAAAVTVWNAPRQAVELSADPVSIAAEAAEPGTMPLAFVDRTPNDGSAARAGPAGTQPLKPHVRTILQGDTLRSIAAEYSVSISTILASNRLDNPNMIRPGQEIVIPPIEGVVADVRPNETLAELAERFGVDASDIAQVNALAAEADAVVPYERIVIPGMETAERILTAAPRRQDTTVTLAQLEDGDASFAAKPSLLTYEVLEGDTVAQLATQFGVSVWTILTANSLSDADLIRPGMELRVLPVNGVEHQIQPGESLSDIAAFYKVDLGPLVDFNVIDDPDTLEVGARITVPGAERAQPTFSIAQIAGPAVRVAAPARAAASSASTTARAATGANGSGAAAAGVSNAQRGTAQTTSAQARSNSSSATAQAASKPQASAAATIPRAAPKPQTTAQAAPKPQTTAQAAAKPQGSGATAQAATASAATTPSSSRVQAATITAPLTIASGASASGASAGGASGSGVVGTAMKHLGARYVFGGTSPSGFDCSGFVWYVHNALGRSVSRGLWGQMNGGPRIASSELQPGDAVFFANTYMPGLSHSGIYVGGGRFIHASDESSGVKISSLSDSYWGPRYVGASRLW